MNKVILIGRLTKVPELRFTPGNGTAVCNFTLATDRWNKQTNQNEADFIPVVVWGKQAENVANYLNKGSQLAVSGRIQTRSYDAKDGTKRYVTEVVADPFGGIQFVGSKNNGNAGNNNNQGYSSTPPQNNYTDFSEDITPVDDGELPF